ncbi:MAG: Rieske 2Fe-2S domain-containing protein [Gemmatimonadaceae bacterium]|nr:Rieske 2Fe-2S domain-containing protein [Gemmatimonadaceae bacterium]
MDGLASVVVTTAAHGFEQLARLDDLLENIPVSVTRSNGEKVCLVRTQGEVAAVSNLCTHQEFDMALGDAPGDGTIECAWHGARFDIRTGEVLQGPATDPLPVYEVIVQDGAVLVGPRRRE